MREFRRFRTLAICLVALGGLGLPGAAQDREEDFGEDEPEPLVVGTVTAIKGAISVKTLTERNAAWTNSAAFVNLASTSITIPAGQTGRVLASFAGEARCHGSAFGWCAIRVLVDGVEMFPQVGTQFAFTSPIDKANESKSIDRVSAELLEGTHTVTLQWAVVNGATVFDMDDWQLKLAVWRTS